MQLAKDVGVPESDIMQWDIEETKKGLCCVVMKADADQFQAVLSRRLLRMPISSSTASISPPRSLHSSMSRVSRLQTDGYPSFAT